MTLDRHLLFIRLDPPAQGFHSPGDVVSGQICLRHFQLSAIGRLEVALEGHARASCHKANGAALGSVLLESNAALVSSVQRLTTGETLPPGDLASWPFDMVIPDTVQLLRLPPAGSEHGSWDQFRRADGFRRTPVTASERPALPPTFRSRSEYAMEWIDLDIDYAISARASISGRVLDAKKPVRIVPAAPPAARLRELQSQRVEVVEAFRRKTLRLLPEHAERVPTIRERTRSLFHSSSVPFFHFKLHAAMARHHCMGEQLPVQVRLEPLDFERTMLREAPSVTLRAIHARLCAQTAYRVATTLGFDVRDKSEVIQEWAVPCNESFRAEQAYEKSFWLPPVSLRKAGPSFNTMNIRRSYTMRLTISASCAGGAHEAKSEFAVTIYGPRKEHEGRMQDGASGWMGGPVESEEQLPSYESAMGQGARRPG